MTIEVRPVAASSLTLPLTLFFAFSVGVIVMNLFAAQPLAGPIGADLGIPPGLAAMLPQLGYAGGLVLLVPLSDLLENRRLIAGILLASALFLALTAVTRSGAVSMSALLLAGFTSSVIQMLVPMAASMAAESHRGRAVGNVMSGVMLGILLSRPIAGLIAGAFGWRGFYGAMGLIEVVLAAALWGRLPDRLPVAQARYGQLLASLLHLLRSEKVLQRGALSAGLVMASFSVFWTAVALRLAEAPFSFDLRDVAWFALAGVSGVVATPIAGWAGDRGWERIALLLGHLAMLAAWIGIDLAGTGGWSSTWTAIGVLALGAAILDAGTVCDQTLGRRAVNLLNPAARGRLNGLFVGLFFVGGALGSVLSGLAWKLMGWHGVCGVGLLFTLMALAVGQKRLP